MDLEAQVSVLEPAAVSLQGRAPGAARDELGRRSAGLLRQGVERSEPGPVLEGRTSQPGQQQLARRGPGVPVIPGRTVESDHEPDGQVDLVG